MSVDAFITNLYDGIYNPGNGELFLRVGCVVLLTNLLWNYDRYVYAKSRTACLNLLYNLFKLYPYIKK